MNRFKTEERRKEQHNKEMMIKAEKIGVSGNTDLASYIEYMEERIKALEECMRDVYKKEQT